VGGREDGGGGPVVGSFCLDGRGTWR